MRRIGVGEVRISAKASLNVNAALRSHRLTAGRFTREFETGFARRHGRNFACMVNSGTDALRIGLAAMKEKYGWKSGDQVAVPAVTFVATLNIVRQVGLSPYLVDIETDHFGMNQSLIPDNVVAAVPVNLFGHVNPTMRKLAKSDIKVLTDSCETMGMNGCAEGDVSAFSTYAAHILTTGVGGLATTNDPELALLIRSYANHGRSGIYTGIDQELGSVEVIEARFHFDRKGFSSRVTELEAAIGCAELETLDANIKQRQKNAAALSWGLLDLPVTTPKWDNDDSAWMMYPILCEDRETRDRLVAHLEANGIETRMLLPLTNQPYIRKMYRQNLDTLLPVAHRVNETGFYLGCHQYLGEEEMEYICTVMGQFDWR